MWNDGEFEMTGEIPFNKVMLVEAAKVSSWAIVGVALGTAAALTLIFLCFFLIRKKIKAKQYKRIQDNWEIPFNKEMLVKELGQGTCGGAPHLTITIQHPYQLRKGHRMEKPDLCPDDMDEVMTNCWKIQPEERSSASDVIQTLETPMTRDNPYFEFMGIDENKDCLVPSNNSAPDESDEEDYTMV